MADVKISAAADVGTVVATDRVPLARSASTTAYAATMAELATYANGAYAPNYYTGTPVMDGTGAAGSAAFVSRGDHVHPTDTSRYAASNPSGYQTAAQVTTSLAPYANDVGRNLLHNSLFNVSQRGAGPWTASGAYTLDRWTLILNLDTASVQQGVVVDSDRTQIGDQAAAFELVNTFTGNAGAAAYNFILQRTENVRRLAGKTVTVSFYAAASAALKLGVSLDQSFGSGGSPSAQVSGTGQSVTLGTTWARYSLTFALASATGKTLGTNGDSYTSLNFWYSCGTTYAAGAGNVGVQSGTVGLWGVQLEIGSVATPLEKPDPQQDLAKCQRFASIILVNIRAYAGAAGAVFAHTVTYPQAMRTGPTATITSAGAVLNSSSYGLTPGDARNGTYSITATAAGDCYAVNFIYLLSADL